MTTLLSPLTPELPLMTMEPEAFERFCCDLIRRLPGVEGCHRHGVRGDAQQGIDIAATMVDGQRWVFQCKRERRFGPAKFQKAVARASFPANRYVLLLASRAGARLRTQVDRQPGWLMWDSEDIAREVRQLPPESARVLVDTHFGGGVRAAFLGITGAAQLVSVDAFLGDLLRHSRLFHHAWPLTGREEVLEGLERFVRSSDRRIAVLPGRGGIGKTRLLRAFAERAAASDPGLPLRFAIPDLPLAPALDALEPVPSVIVVDDAHRRDDLRYLLAFAFRRDPPLRLVLAVRPHARDRILGEIGRAGFDHRTDVTVLDELRELTPAQSEALAREALGPEYGHLARELVARSGDSPLMTVLGGQLVQSRRIHPALLPRDNEFRREVLKAFGDAPGEGGGADARLPREILRLAAAVGPFRPDLQPFRDAASAFLHVHVHDLLDVLRELEDAGVLLRQGRTLRVTPDLYADYVLEEACFTSDGTQTGYAGRVHQAFRQVAAGALLRNLAELDWRRYHGGAATTGEVLLGEIWDGMEAEFRAARAARRLEIIDALYPVAYYQPEPALRLVRIAAQPGGGATAEEAALAQALPPVLASIAYNLEFTAECCDLLWQLGRDAPLRALNDPDHSIQILQEMAGYRDSKPLVLQEEVLAAVQRWLAEPGAHDHLHSPLDVLNPLIAKTFMSPWPVRAGEEWRPLIVNPEPTAELRARVLAVIARTAEHAELRAVLHAVQSLGAFLQGPVRLMQIELPDGLVARWKPERMRALSVLAGVCARAGHPLVTLECLRVLESGRDEALPEAEEVLRTIPRTLDVRFAELLLRPSILPVYAVEPWITRYAALDEWERHEEARRETVQEVLVQYARPADAVVRIAWELAVIKAVGVVRTDRMVGMVEKVGPEPCTISLAQHLAALAPDYLAELCARAALGPPSHLQPHLEPLFHWLRRVRPDRYLPLARRILEAGDVACCGALAPTLCDSDGAPLAGADDLLSMALRHPHEWVRWNALRPLQQLAEGDPARAMQLVLEMEIGSSTVLAEQFAELFEEWHIAPQSIPAAAWEPLLQKLVPVEHLDTLTLHRLLGAASIHAPGALMRMLIGRVRHAATESPSYRPVPRINAEGPRGFLQSPEHEAILREVRDSLFELPAPADRWVPRLYALVSVGYGDAGLCVLQEWIDGDDVRGIGGACALLAPISPGAVLDQSEFVQKLLDRAVAAGPDALRAAEGALLDALDATAEKARLLRDGSELVGIRDGGRALGSRRDLTRLARDLYRRLADAADRFLQTELASDDEHVL